MSEDVSAEVAGLISNAKVFGSSDNIRHGKYKMLITRIHAQKVDTDKGKHRMAFVEMTPLESKPNPQVEGDRVDYVSAQQPGVGPLKDDGNKPNAVGSKCALKVDFDGAGALSAGANIKAFVLGLFGKRDGEIPDTEVNQTWVDLARTKDVKVGDPLGVDPNTQQVIYAKTAKRANPACGMIVYCETITKKKKVPNDKGMYITKMIWSCGTSPVGLGENTPELVEKRRLEIEAQRAEEDEEDGTPSVPSQTATAPASSPYTQAAQSPAPPPPAPPAPAAPSVPSVWMPPAPWQPHPTTPVDAQGTRWFFDGASQVKSEAQLRAGA